MKAIVAAIGKLQTGPEYDWCNQYLVRLRRCWDIVINEFEIKKDMPDLRRKTQETKLLLDVVRPCGWVCVLDSRGQSMDSEAWAGILQKNMVQSVGTLGFLIGGADGFDHDLFKDTPHFKLAMGPMTWPHRLVRVMLLEQLYRAQQILSNGPYHH